LEDVKNLEVGSFKSLVKCEANSFLKAFSNITHLSVAFLGLYNLTSHSFGGDPQICRSSSSGQFSICHDTILHSVFPHLKSLNLYDIRAGEEGFFV
jgi:hypothetical protein